MDSAFRRWIKSNVPVGIRRAGKASLFETSAALQTWWTALTCRPPRGDALKINVGCGAKRKEGWVNLDLHPAADIRTDARRRLPVRSGSANLIYSEHFFEHLEYPEETTAFLKESLRVLAPVGIFSVGVPDTELCLRSYVEGTFSRANLNLQTVDWCQTPMQFLNFLFHQGGEHKQLYDYSTLQEVLRAAGFCNVHRREFDPAMDSEDRRIGTLYVSAQKPEVADRQ
jgi:predicted SAM-dependent methyltransferase